MTEPSKASGPESSRGPHVEGAEKEPTLLEGIRDRLVVRLDETIAELEAGGPRYVIRLTRPSIAGLEELAECEAHDLAGAWCAAQTCIEDVYEAIGTAVADATVTVHDRLSGDTKRLTVRQVRQAVINLLPTLMDPIEAATGDGRR